MLTPPSRPALPFLLLLLAGPLCPVPACYECFAKSAENFCTEYMRQTWEEVRRTHCWLPIMRLLKKRPLYWVRVAASEYKQLKSIYSHALSFIKKRRRKMPSESYASLLDSVEQEVLYKVYNLKEATPCNQTCGINEATTYFDCRLCRLHECEGITFDCEIEDVRVKETGQVSMKCRSSFVIPKFDSVTWWFAPFVRSDIIQQFKILHIGTEDTLSISNVKMKNTGSYGCDVIWKDTILLRRFFHLIVTRSTLQSSIDLQAMFQNVLVERTSTLRPPTARPKLSPAQRLRRQTEAQLTIAVALATIIVIIAVGGIYRWTT